MDPNGKKEMLAWIRRNEQKFKAEEYTKEEIANLAIACGFNRIVVAEWQTQAKFKEAI